MGREVSGAIFHSEAGSVLTEVSTAALGASGNILAVEHRLIPESVACDGLDDSDPRLCIDGSI
jgi:hypothetical protein